MYENEGNVVIEATELPACGLVIQDKLNNLRKRANERNKEFTIKSRHLEKLFQLNDGTCDYTGVRFSDIPNAELFPSIDRINPSFGYIPGNIILCTRVANNLKERYFETESLPYVKAEDLTETYKIYEKLKDLSSLMNKSLLDDDEVPKIRTSAMVESFVRKVKKSKHLGIKVPDLEELNLALHNITTFPLKSINTEPSDYKHCKEYIKFCDANKNVTMTYMEYKTKVTQEICDFSNTVIENRALFIVDHTKHVTFDNIIVVDAKYIPVLKAMKDGSISFAQMKMFTNNLCNNINKD